MQSTSNQATIESPSDLQAAAEAPAHQLQAEADTPVDIGSASKGGNKRSRRKRSRQSSVGKRFQRIDPPHVAPDDATAETAPVCELDDKPETDSIRDNDTKNAPESEPLETAALSSYPEIDSNPGHLAVDDFLTEEPATRIRPISKWRLRFVMAVVLSVWMVLIGRLVFLQAIAQPDFALRARQQRLYVESIHARPGDIVDRHGRLLATTVKSRSLFVDPKRIEQPWRFAMRVSEPLGLDADAVFERIMRHRTKRFLWIKRRLTEADAEIIERLDLPDGTWGFRKEYMRQYPQGPLAAHVLGLRDIDGIGRGGIEQSCDDLLAGRDGERLLDRDARGVVVNVREEIARAPHRGHTVMLTVDSVIQLHVERELNQLVKQWQPKSACAIVMDCTNGEILAMSSRPTFDPNLPAEVPDDAWKNSAMSSIYEPGSTIKPLIVAWALQRQLIKRGESIHCGNGAYRMGRRVLHDHHSYGSLSVTDILVKSSNIGMAKIGERLQNEGLHEAVTRFGFGRPTGIELSGELSGIVRPLAQWDPYSTGSVPMGQEIAVTPLQMITAQAGLANSGKLPQPHLVLKHLPVLARLNGESPQESVTPKILSAAVEPEIAKWLVEEPLAQVIARGTGRRANVQNYAAFGKTGTSQKLDPDTGTYSRTAVVCSFICGAPVKSPKVMVFVVADEPTGPGLHFGGTVAAPTAGTILQKALIHLRVAP
ncbi:MAG: penicillin-binding protein 2 [Planctomycetota bacterium]|nr:penicillin-binding protein 2 [Planctomycetota bacterium]